MELVEECLIKFDQHVRFPLRVKTLRLKRKITNYMQTLHITRNDIIFILIIIPLILAAACLLEYAFY